jgi:hypothetical protein
MPPMSLCGSVCVHLSLIGNDSVKTSTETTTIHATIEELLDTSFSEKSVSHERTYVISSSQKFLLDMFCIYMALEVGWDPTFVTGLGSILPLSGPGCS